MASDGRSGDDGQDKAGLLKLAAEFGPTEDPEAARLLPDRLERIVGDFRAHREMERHGPRAGQTRDALRALAAQAEAMAASLRDASWAVRDAIVAASDGGTPLDQWLREGRGSAPGDWYEPRAVRPSPGRLFVEGDLDPSLGDDPPPLWARLHALGWLARAAVRNIPEDRGGRKNVVTWSRGTASGQMVRKVAWLMARHAGWALSREGRGILLDQVLTTTPHGAFHERCLAVHAYATNEEPKDNQLLSHVREVASLLKKVAALHQRLFDLDKEVEEAERRALGSPERDAILAGEIVDPVLDALASERQGRTFEYQTLTAGLRAV